MTFPMPKGSTLVDLANEQSLLLYCVVIGDQHGAPSWVELTADGTDILPARRLTLVREPGECCSSLWSRVLSGIRELKRKRGIQHRVLVHCRTDKAPRNEAELDTRFNMTRALWFEVEGARDAHKQVKALSMLADLSAYQGKLPPWH